VKLGHIGRMASTVMTWEITILRKIYGPKCERRVWRIKSNLEVQNVYKSTDILTVIKIRRLEWLEPVIRMEDSRIPKMTFNTKPEGRRKWRWLDDVEADINILGIKNGD
jgi:hypothetical protein